jgi:hypothetical protein
MRDVWEVSYGIKKTDPHHAGSSSASDSYPGSPMFYVTRRFNAMLKHPAKGFDS